MTKRLPARADRPRLLRLAVVASPLPGSQAALGDDEPDPPRQVRPGAAGGDARERHRHVDHDDSRGQLRAAVARPRASATPARRATTSSPTVVSDRIERAALGCQRLRCSSAAAPTTTSARRTSWRTSYANAIHRSSGSTSRARSRRRRSVAQRLSGDRRDSRRALRGAHRLCREAGLRFPLAPSRRRRSPLSPRPVRSRGRSPRRALSNEVITPGVTTLEDVAWWIRDRLFERGLDSVVRHALDLHHRARGNRGAFQRAHHSAR